MKNIFIVISLLLYFSANNLIASENKILFKINNEIITTIDIKNEIKYLKATNKNINNLNTKQLLEIAKKSLINEKVKKSKILSFIEKIEIEEKFLDPIIFGIVSRNNLKNKDELKNYFKTNNIQYSYMLNKLAINAFWNQIILENFSSRVVIDKKKIKENILKKKNFIRTYSLSEIVFDIGNNESLKKKFDLIENNISNQGFYNTALQYSISSSSSQGGEIGWISENSLNKKLLNEINKLQINEYTKPVVIPGGFIIIKLHEVKKEEKEINLEKEIEKVIQFQTNQQLNTFSNIYLKKIMKDYKIEKL